MTSANPSISTPIPARTKHVRGNADARRITVDRTIPHPASRKRKPTSLMQRLAGLCDPDLVKPRLISQSFLPSNHQSNPLLSASIKIADVAHRKLAVYMLGVK
jgi:hypothetical protein